MQSPGKSSGSVSEIGRRLAHNSTVMGQQSFYDRPLVRRLQDIFWHPKPPMKVTQRQFDGADKELRVTAGKRWDEIDSSDYWHYLLDLCYVELQPDLFDYLFPAFLIRWWEGLVSRQGGPESECDFYRAIDRGQVFAKMMSLSRREQVYAWMVDAYMDAVDQWGGNLSLDYDSKAGNKLQGPLTSFHAIGQSIPILPEIWDRLQDVKCLGVAQWWLVLGIGIAWDENECPYIPAWTRDHGGGGVYILESDASIFEHGYLAENLECLNAELTIQLLIEKLFEASPFLSETSFFDLLFVTRQRLEMDPEFYQARIQRFLHYLGQPNLGGVIRAPLAG